MFDARYFAFASISALLVISPGATMAVVMETVMGEGRLAGLLTVLGINVGNSTLALSSALGMSFIFHAWPWALEAVKIGGAVYLGYLGVRGVWHAWRGTSTRLKPCAYRNHGPAAVSCADRDHGPAAVSCADRDHGPAAVSCADRDHGPAAVSGADRNHGPAAVSCADRDHGPAAVSGGDRDHGPAAVSCGDRNHGPAAVSGGDSSHGQAARRASAGPNLRACLSRGIITNLLNPPVVLFYMTFLPQFIGPRDPFFTRFLVLAATHVGMSLAWLFFYAFALGVLADRFARPAVRSTLEAVTGVVLVGFGVRLLLR